MIKLIVINIFILLIGTSFIFATPRDVEVWFLTMENKTALNQSLVKIESPLVYSDLFTMRDCLPMGDGCFHPQDGFIVDPDKEMKPKKLKPLGALKTINAMDVDLITCDKNNYFDIYCGKASKKIKKKNNIMEIWIDVSASLKQYDFSSEPGQCQRKSFLGQVISECSASKINISVFNTSLKEAGSLASVCDTYGMNDTKRLIRWIKNSTAKKLIIVTDIDEYNIEFGAYLKLIHAKIRGETPDGFTARDLSNSAGEIISYCKKQ